MKTFISSSMLFFFLLTTIQAQTKKIALRSHSGNNATFTIHVPDEFGRAPIEYYEKDQLLQKEIIRKKRAAAEKKQLQQNKLPKMPQNGFELKSLDTTVCRPNLKTDPIIQDTTSKKHLKNNHSKKQPTNKSIDQESCTPEQHNPSLPKKIGRGINSSKQGPKTIKTTPPTPKKGSLIYLFWTLTIPAILSIIIKSN